jgi:uroporphyrinogen-III synthase
VALDQRVIEDARRGALDATLVTSGTVARQIAIQFGAARTQTALVAMGPQTADDARAVGLEIAAVADPHDAEGLLDAVAGLAARGRRAAGATTISRSPRSHGRM